MGKWNRGAQRKDGGTGSQWWKRSPRARKLLPASLHTFRCLLQLREGAGVHIVEDKLQPASNLFLRLLGLKKNPSVAICVVCVCARACTLSRVCTMCVHVEPEISFDFHSLGHYQPYFFRLSDPWAPGILLPPRPQWWNYRSTLPHSDLNICLRGFWGIKRGATCLPTLLTEPSP